MSEVGAWKGAIIVVLHPNIENIPATDSGLRGATTAKLSLKEEFAQKGREYKGGKQGKGVLSSVKSIRSRQILVTFVQLIGRINIFTSLL